VMLTLHVDGVFSVAGFNNPCQMSLAPDSCRNSGRFSFVGYCDPAVCNPIKLSRCCHVDHFFAMVFAMLFPCLSFVGFHPDLLFPSGDAPQMTADPLLTHSRTSPGHPAALV